MAVPTRRDPPTPRDYRNDLWLSAAMTVGGVISVGLGSAAGLFGIDGTPLWAGILYAFGIGAPLAVRRRFPATVAFVVAAVFIAGTSQSIPELYAGTVALFISLYTVGAWVNDRTRALWVRVIVIAGMFTALLVTMAIATTQADPESEIPLGAMSPLAAALLLQFLINIAFFAGAYYFGDRAFAAAIERRQLEQRTEELEEERELSAAQAVALDRVRIARELHDVVAHHVSAMGVQAGAARTVWDTDPATARAALESVEDSARSALTEMRTLLETLRSAPSDEDNGSTVSVDHLDSLVAYADANGLPTELMTIGTPVPLPRTVSVNLYRVAQEALTNARRYGGNDARADVRLRYDPDAVELEVSNTGAPVSVLRPGMGLVGIRERATASGGTAEITPRMRGGLLIRVRVPLAEGAAA